MDVASMPTDAPPRIEPGGPTPPDAVLVRDALGGDLAGFGLLYDRYARLVRATCFDLTGDSNLAEDLTHETFLRAHRALPALRTHEKFAPWLMGIAHRVGKDWQRRRARERKHLGSLAAAPQPPPARDPAAQDLEPLRRAMLKLPPKERTALHLLYLDDQPPDRAQRLLGLSRSGFYKLLDRAKKRLRKLLIEEEGNP